MHGERHRGAGDDLGRLGFGAELNQALGDEGADHVERGDRSHRCLPVNQHGSDVALVQAGGERTGGSGRVGVDEVAVQPPVGQVDVGDQWRSVDWLADGEADDLRARDPLSGPLQDGAGLHRVVVVAAEGSDGGEDAVEVDAVLLQEQGPDAGGEGLERLLGRQV